MAADVPPSDDYRTQVRVMSEAMPAAVSITDPRGRIIWVNPYWSRSTGVPFEDALSGGWALCIQPGDLPRVEEAFAAALGSRNGFSLELLLRAAAGDWRWSKVKVEPLINTRNRIEGWISVATEIDEEVKVRHALQESEERFRLLAEDAPVNLWIGDEQGRCVYLNRAQRAFWGVPDDLGGFSWGSTLLEEDAERLFAAFNAAMQAQTPFEVEARYRRADGAVRTLRTTARPRHDASGRFLGMIGVNIDLTDARAAERRQALLVNELNHRVKNTLATVQSITSQSLRASQDVAQAADVLEGRLVALSKAHDILNRSSWDAANLTEVVGEALHPFQSPETARFEITGEAVDIAPRAALAVSLVLHELATNAMKHGALSQAGGVVSLAWSSAGPATVEVVWRESGGPEVAAPSRRGFGTRLLANLAADLGASARVEYRPEGLDCRFEVPIGAAEAAEVVEVVW